MCKSKKGLLISFVIIFMVCIAVVVSRFSECGSTTPTTLASEDEISDYTISPYITLFGDTVYSKNGGWVSQKFSATEENGKYIRFWYDNTTDEKVAVYLYRADSEKEQRVASMKVDAHSEKSEVYSNKDADSGT